MRVSISPVRRYGLVALLVIALGVVWFFGHFPATAAPGPAVAPPTVPQVQVLLPTRLTNGLRIVSGGLFSIDAVIDGNGPRLIQAALRPLVPTKARRSIAVVGWAVDAGAGQPAAGLIGVLDGTIVLTGHYGMSRPDVAKAFNNPAFAPSGFSVAVPARLLPAGPHTFQILILSTDRSTYYQPPKVITLNADA